MKKLNNFAIEFIPIRLIISIILIGFISSLILTGFLKINIITSENQIENQCRLLESKLITMVVSGVARNLDLINSTEGTKRSQVFILPDNLIYLSFGVDPEPDNNGILTTGLTNNGSAIFYKVDGGNKKVIWLDSKKFHFREGFFINNKWYINGKGQGLILIKNGTVKLIFELVQKNDEIYILIHLTDNVEYIN